jgi:hypothetical protein
MRKITIYHYAGYSMYVIANTDPNLCKNCNLTYLQRDICGYVDDPDAAHQFTSFEGARKVRQHNEFVFPLTAARVLYSYQKSK